MDDAQAPTIVNLGDGALNRTPEGVFCMKCRYDLRGLPLDGLCPECGTGVRDSIPLGCVGFAYDPRGLRESDSCPECGLPVATSLARNLRIGADLGFVRRLRSGLSWVLNGILVYLVIGIGGGVAGFAMQWTLLQPTVGILILIGPLIALVLYWNLHNLLIKQLRSIVQDRERAAETPSPAIAS